MGSPRGCWVYHHSFRVLLTILHQKDIPLDAQDSLSDPPAAVSTVGSRSSTGNTCAGCGNSNLKLQRSRGCCSPLVCFAGKAARLPAACPPTASPQRRQERLVHMSTGTRAAPPEEAPPSPMPRSKLFINECGQSCMVPTSTP